MEYTRARENLFEIKPYLGNQNQMKESMRRILAEWMVQVEHNYGNQSYYRSTAAHCCMYMLYSIAYTAAAINYILQSMSANWYKIIKNKRNN